uniref:Uncharacterized protein n=1 Tax=Varanus komodoensis TaxID=61221 RepID=A0A8D2JBQ9_VARKO
EGARGSGASLAPARAMRGPRAPALLCLALAALLSPPAEAWYKQAAGPSYYSVGRASGLLSGIRRSPYMRRSGSDDNGGTDSSAENSAAAAAAFLAAEPRQSPGGLRNMVRRPRAGGRARLGSESRRPRQPGLRRGEGVAGRAPLSLFTISI